MRRTVGGRESRSKESPVMAKHRVLLTPAERKQLQSLLRRSSSTAIQQRRARSLPASDVARTACVCAGAAPPPTRQKPVFPPRRKLSDVQEAQVLVLAQSEPPEGY